MTKTIYDWLMTLTNQKFWGIIELTFQGGKIVMLKKNESIKPENL